MAVIIQAGLAHIVSRPAKDVPERWQADVALARQILAEAGISYREVPLP
jgi:hypothetical protein